MVEFVLVIVWLALGGWAYSALMTLYEEQGGTKNVYGAMFGLCLVFGPFMAGAAWFEVKHRKAKELAEEGK